MEPLTQSVESFCWTDFFTHSSGAYKIFNSSILVSLIVVVSYFGYLALKHLTNILWYHFMVSVNYNYINSVESLFVFSICQ